MAEEKDIQTYGCTISPLGKASFTEIFYRDGEKEDASHLDFVYDVYTVFHRNSGITLFAISIQQARGMAMLLHKSYESDSQELIGFWLLSNMESVKTIH
jgi:hypothetical protein